MPRARLLLLTLTLTLLVSGSGTAGAAELEGITLDSGRVRVQLRSTAAGRYRRVDASEDFSIWTPMEVFAPTNTSPSLLDPVQAGRSRFYRALSIEPELRVFDVRPSSGEAGARVMIEGQFFSRRPGENLVTFGGASAVVVSSTGTRLEVIVPQGSPSGGVRVQVGNEAAVAPTPFVPLRRLTAIVDPGLPPGSYSLFSLIGEITNGPPGMVLAKADQPTLVFAMPNSGNTQALFLAMALPGEDPVRLNPKSTAEALVLVQPLFSSTDPHITALVRAAAAAEPGMKALETLVETVWRDAGDPYANPKVHEAIASVSRAVLERTRGETVRLQQRHRSDRGRLVLPTARALDDYSFDLEYVLLDYQTEEGEALGALTREFRWTYGPRQPKINSVDWLVRVEQIDLVKLLPEGRRDLTALLRERNPLQTFPLTPGFLFKGTVEPKLVTDGFNLVKRALKAAFDYDKDALAPEPKALQLPDQDGIYLARIIGPGFGPDDEAIFAREHYPDQRAVAVSKNVVSGAMDLFGAVIDVGGLDFHENLLKELLGKAALEAAKQAPTIRTAGDVIDAVVGLIDFIVQELADKGREAVLEQWSKSATKAGTQRSLTGLQSLGKTFKGVNTFFKALDVIGGVGMVAQRAAGFVATTPMETALIVVGEPFRLEWVDIQPPSAGPGTEVTLRYKAPQGFPSYLPEGPFDSVDFEGPAEWKADVLAADGPDTSGIYSIRTILPDTLASAADGVYRVTVNTHGRQAQGEFTLDGRPRILSMTPSEGFAATNNFNGGPYAGSELALRVVNIRATDRVLFPSASGAIEVTNKTLASGVLKFRVPPGGGSGPIRITHTGNDGTTNDLFTSTFTVLGPPVIESVSTNNARRGDVLVFRVRNTTAEPGTTLARFTGPSTATVAAFVAGDQLIGIPAQAATGPITLLTPAGSASLDFSLNPGLASGGLIEIRSNAINDLQRGCDFANGTAKPLDDKDTETDAFGNTVSLDPPKEEGDFVTDTHRPEPLRFPVGAEYADTLSIGDVGGEGVLTGHFEKVQIGAGFRGVLRVKGDFCTVNAGAPFPGTVIIEGNHCVVDGFSSSTTFSGSAGTPLVIRGNYCTVKARFTDNAGDGLRIEGGSFNRVQVFESRNNGGSGVVLTGGAHGNTVQLNSGIPRSGGNDVEPGSGNRGHGLLFLGSATDNTITAFTPGLGGNGGDGLRLDGPGVSNNVIRITRFMRNQGNGVTLTNSASNNMLFDPIDPDASFREIFLSISNSLHGVAVHGGASNVLSFASSGNGGDGLHISGTVGGPRSSRFGLRTYDFETRGNGGAGVRITGDATGVWVFGIQGTSPSLTDDRIGLVIEGDNTRSNLLERLVIENPRSQGMELGGSRNDVHVDVTKSAGDGVVLFNSRQNTLRITQVTSAGGRGILVTAGSQDNRILGAPARPGVAGTARISQSKSDGIVITSGARRNVFRDLLVQNNGGHGILIQEPLTDGNHVRGGRISANALSAAVIGYGASQNILGPTSASAADLSLDSGTSTNPVVVVIGQASMANVIRRTRITSTQPAAQRQVGISVRDGAPSTLIEQNTLTQLSIGVEGRDGAVGLVARANKINNNTSHGILLRSAHGFRLGGALAADANIIENQPLGIELIGNTTYDGIVANNTLLNHAQAALRLSGIRDTTIGPLNQCRLNGRGIELIGAYSNRISDNILSDNTVFGAQYRAGSSNNISVRNRITGNPVGVEVRDAGSDGNLIAGPGIFSNSGKGIRLLAGGNHEQPPPRGESFEQGRITGFADAPDLSIVHVFADRQDEGEVLVGTASVASRRWHVSIDASSAAALALFQLNATVTTPSGDTSEFAPLFTPEPASSEAVFVSTRHGNPELYVVDSSTAGVSFANPRRLTTNAAPDLQPALSPDGQRVLFVSERSGQREVYVRSSQPGGTDTRLTVDPAVDEDPAWLSGTQVVFTSTRGGARAIYRMQSTGTGVTNLISSAGENREAAVSPDDRTIAFVTTRNGVEQLFLANSDGSDQRPLGNPPTPGHQPAWSPDGSTIAFTTPREGGSDIAIVRADGTGVTRLTDGTGINRDPAWSLDGRSLVFTSDRNGDRELYLISKTGGPVIPLTSSDGESYEASWGAR